MQIGFDVISDLNLSHDTEFNWEGKSTSLYCIVAGNISSDLRTIQRTLLHLTRCYQGVFYVAGTLEYDGVTDTSARTSELSAACSLIRNVAFLHNHVVIIDGVAIMGATGWYGADTSSDYFAEIRHDNNRYDDLGYLGQSLSRLQLHLDVKKIIVVTNSVPAPELFFGEATSEIVNQLQPNVCLEKDTEFKVSHWIFGSYKKEVDITINDINYINNSYFQRSPYWAKRITVEV